MKDLGDLIRQLRRERLSLHSDQQYIESLRNEVESLSAEVSQLAWRAGHHRRNLKLLILARQEPGPALSIQAENSIKFIEAAHVLGFVEASSYGEFLLGLRESPDLVAESLLIGEKLQLPQLETVIDTLTTGIYSSCFLNSDLRLLLRAACNVGIRQLMEIENPRELLRHNSSAFSRLYSTLLNADFSARLFLGAALNGPLLTALATYDHLLTERSSDLISSERVTRLASLVIDFINSLREHLFCFPHSVAWLLRELLTQSHHGEKEMYEFCADLLLTHFICPAIVEPGNFGITDAPVSHIARLNLIQIANTLQMMANRKYDSKTEELFSLLPADGVTSLISDMMMTVDGFSANGSLTEDPIPSNGATVLLTTSELSSLVSFMQSVQMSDQEFQHRTKLDSLLINLPKSIIANGHGDHPNRFKSYIDNNCMEPVMIVRLPVEPDVAPLLSEEEVLEAEEKPATEVALTLPDATATNPSHEKRTRFSLSHDEGSIGNTSDNLEAISEAASNHSGASSLDSGEDQNDNLSDMVSANVSGRGSPNISGRDTPSSQVTEGGEAQPAPPPPVAPTKQSRSDIDDKFGKFEIKKQELLLADETVSLVSDTWSTDVLASDSEIAESAVQNAAMVAPPIVQTAGLDASETASEAWSTDVIASDSERLTEVDTDDTASVARSDDTAHSDIVDAPTINLSIPKRGTSTPNKGIKQMHSAFESRPASRLPAQLLENAISEMALTSHESFHAHLPKNDDGDRVFVSSTSLASTSSGSSNAAIATNVKTTNALPKSISFDKTADKDYMSDDKKPKKGFFGNFRMFSVRQRKIKGTSNSPKGDKNEELMRNTSSSGDAIEDILAKYRTNKPTNDDLSKQEILANDATAEELNEGLSDENLFRSAKKKLRLVLSQTELSTWPAMSALPLELEMVLEMALAEARQLRDGRRTSQLREALRCVRLFDADGCRQLCASMRADLSQRMCYAAYLARMRTRYLSQRTTLRRLQKRLEIDQQNSCDAVLAVCVRLFLERHDTAWRDFVAGFRLLSLLDEKTDLLGTFLAELVDELDADPAWRGVSSEQRSAALIHIESAVFSRVYRYAFYPNGDGDVSRDRVLYEHIKKLAAIVTPNHKALQIPKRFHGECPWPSAQSELRALSAQWTPRGKIRCVAQCAAAIFQLLSMSATGGGAAADDFLPVLVYVVIAANPPSLLSTVQYVEGFAGEDVLQGEDRYWWTQFVSAIELIKTMDYNH